MTSSGDGFPVSLASSVESSTAPPSSSPSFSKMPSSAKISCQASFSACFSALLFRCLPSEAALSGSLKVVPCFLTVRMIPDRDAEKLSIRDCFDKSNKRRAAANCSSRVPISRSCSSTSASNLFQRTPSEPFVTFTVTHWARTLLTDSSSVSDTFLESRTNNAIVSEAAFCCVSDCLGCILEPFLPLPRFDSPPCKASIASSRSSSSCSEYFCLARLALARFPRDISFCFFLGAGVGLWCSLVDGSNDTFSVRSFPGPAVCSTTNGDSSCSSSESGSSFASISTSASEFKPSCSSASNTSLSLTFSLFSSAAICIVPVTCSWDFIISSCSISAKSLLSLACLIILASSPSLNNTPKPISRLLAGKKFFLPRIMNEPTVKYSPVGAVFETWWDSTQYAEVTIFDVQADERQIVNVPASLSARSDKGMTWVFPSAILLLFARKTQVAAPWTSACKYASPGRRYLFTSCSFCWASFPATTR